MMRLILVFVFLGIGGIWSIFSFPAACSLYLWNNIFQPYFFAKNPHFFPSAQYVFGVMVFSFFVNWFRGKIFPRGNIFIFQVVLFLSWALICSFKSPFQMYVWDEYITILKYILPLLLISSCLSDEKAVSLIAAVLMLSVGVWSAQAGVKGLVSGVTRNMMIPGGQMSDNNDFMAATVGTLPFLVFWIKYYHFNFSKLVKLGLILMLVLSLSAIVFSDSRGSVLGLAAMILLFIIIISKKKVRNFVILSVLISGIVLVLPESFFERLGTIEISTQQTEGSAKERIMLMAAAYRATMDNPFFGVGSNCWILIADMYTSKALEPHCAYLKLSAELGIPGCLLYLLIVISTLGRLLWARNKYFQMGLYQNTDFLSVFICSIIGISVCFIFLNHPYSEYLWAIIAIANAYITIVNKEDTTGEEKSSVYV